MFGWKKKEKENVKRCARCGKEISGRDKVWDYYCPDCARAVTQERREARMTDEEKARARQTRCVQCDKEITDGFQMRGYCHDCWCARLKDLREFYRPYEERLRAVLEERGIHTTPGTVSGLDEAGRPLEAAVRTELPLKYIGHPREYAVWLFQARDALFAFSDLGVGLDYLIPSADSDFMKQVDDLFLAVKEDGDLDLLTIEEDYQYLAAVSDGTHVYVLSISGKIYHTNPQLPKPIPVATRLELHQEIWHAFFTDEQLRESAAKLSDPQRGIVRIFNTEHFDPAQKMFFWICAYGDYYHGYDVSYPRLTKEEMIHRMLHYKRLYETWEQCRRGEIPKIATVELIEEAPADMEYVPQGRFGEGLYF